MLDAPRDDLLPTPPRTTFVVVGLGGLGCPALLALLGAGATSVRLVDPDVVEVSNLQRQVLYSLADVGMPKAQAAAIQLRRRSRHMHIETSSTRLDVDDVEAFVEHLAPGSIVLECTDDPHLKFAFNDACLVHDVPLVIGAALGLRAQVLAVRRGGACYRCIYEEPPAAAMTCAAAGVPGP